MARSGAGGGGGGLEQLQVRFVVGCVSCCAESSGMEMGMGWVGA